MQDTGVAGLPGCDFGRQAHELSARLAYVDFDGAAALAASAGTRAGDELDEPFLRSHTGDVIDAIERVCEWLTAAA